MEQAFLVTETFAPLTVVSVLRLANGPAPETLARALARLQQRQPLLRAYLRRHRGRAVLDLDAAAPPIPMRLVGWRDEQQWRGVAKTELNARVDPTIAPLMRCVYLYGAGDNAPSDLIVAYHHTIMDAASGIQLYHQLLTLCAAAPGDDAPLPLLPAAEAFFPKAFQGLQRWLRLPSFMWRQMRREIGYQKAMASQMPVRPASSCDILTMDMSTAATASLVRRARRERVTLNGALAAAMLLALHEQFYQQRDLPFRGIAFANLRPYLKPAIPDEQLGCYISMLPYTVELRRDTPFWQLARRINDEVYQAGKSGDKFLAAIMSKSLMQMIVRLRRFRMGAAALSYVGPVRLEPVYGATRVRSLHGFTANNSLGPLLAAFVKIYQGQLMWDLQYLTGDMDRRMAQALADAIRAILEKSVSEAL